MDNSNRTDPIIPPMERDPNLKEYVCPYCGKFLFKGRVERLNMICHHCQKLIKAESKDLLKPEE